MPEFREDQRRDVDVFLHEPALHEVLSRRKPTRYFWCDMTDLFGEWVPDEAIDRCFAVMALTPQHTHLVLTKRPARMKTYLTTGNRAELIAQCLPTFGTEREGFISLPLSNAWIGTSVENQHFADERIPLLLQTPAAVRFLSCEPLLEGLDLAKHRPGANRLWVIVGGESGPGARPCHVEWVRSIVRQCQESDTRVFVKQVGSVPYVRAARLRHWEWRDIKRPEDQRFTEAPTDALGWRVHLSDRKGGDMAEWPEDLRVREFPR